METLTKNLNAIMTYFNVSNHAAIYMYYRRRRGFPWRRKTDSKFLKWDIKIQNAIVIADICNEFDWYALQFGREKEQLLTHGILIDNQPNFPITLHKTNPHNICDADGWIAVSNKKKKTYKVSSETERILHIIGFETKIENLNKSSKRNFKRTK
jgi:hypothetical protein